MKQFTKIKKQNKWTIPILVAIACAVAVFAIHPGNLAAAQEDQDSAGLTIDYLDPFNLTIQQISLSPAEVSSLSVSSAVLTPVAATAPADALASDGVSSGSTYVKPLKVWIPFVPTFRSPCTPSW